MIDISRTDIVILCGGLGKRLKSLTGETPKVMANVTDQPFLDFLVDRVEDAGFRQVVLLTGYKSDEIEQYFRNKKTASRIKFSKEKKPLDTGGAVRHARSIIESEPFVVLNGDSFCPVDYSALLSFHAQKKSLATIVLSRVDDPQDFGTIEMDVDQKISAFKEKQGSRAFGKKDAGLALVNAGVYVFKQKVFELMPHDEKFSLETDFFPEIVGQPIFGFEIKEKFMDIGTPERFSRAQEILKKKG